MSIRGLGRATPAQLLMIGLIGYSVKRAGLPLDISEEEQSHNICRARCALVKLTGEDFGFDIASWHDYLTEMEEHGYTLVYSYSNVLENVETAPGDKDFLQKRSRLIVVLNVVPGG
jgi:hypothetical protein